MLKALHYVEHTLQKVEQSLQGVEQKVQRLEQTLQGMEQKVQRLEQTLQRVEQKIQRVENTRQKPLSFLAGIFNLVGYLQFSRIAVRKYSSFSMVR